MQVKDTVATDEEDDEVHTHDHPWKNGTAVRHDAVIHDHVPVLAGQDLRVQRSVSEDRRRDAGAALCYLEAGEQRLREGVEGAALGLRLVEVELPPEQLHAEQSEDDEEEEEEEQEGGDGLHGIEQRGHQARQRRPVAGWRESAASGRGREEELRRRGAFTASP